MLLDELIDKMENFGNSELIYWSNAIAGEVGELCNLVKKFYRDTIPQMSGKYFTKCQLYHEQECVQIYNCGDLNKCKSLQVTRKKDEMMYELADIFIYIILMSRDILKLDLKEYLNSKLEKIKREREKENRRDL